MQDQHLFFMVKDPMVNVPEYSTINRIVVVIQINNMELKYQVVMYQYL